NNLFYSISIRFTHQYPTGDNRPLILSFTKHRNRPLYKPGMANIDIRLTQVQCLLPCLEHLLTAAGLSFLCTAEQTAKFCSPTAKGHCICFSCLFCHEFCCVFSEGSIEE